jgi:SNF2 family DNA or RNA helicase
LVLCPLSVLDHWNSELQRWVVSDVELVEIKCF